MVNPTNSQHRRFVPRTGRDIWTFPGPPGYLESIQAAGSIAAPLLAGASFTLVALVLQSATPFGRWQDLALLLLVAAGLAQVFAVQSVIWTRRYMVTPDELRQWFPDDFTDGGERPTQWLLNLQGFNDQNARKWADRTRTWINAGISLLLAGVAVGVVPAGHVSAMRWAVITVAWAGVAVEASWVIATAVDEPGRAGMMLRSAVIFTSAGATAAAGFAATAGTTSGAPATWWAVALTVVAMPCWLAAVTDARFSHGRLRLYSPLTGGRAAVQAAVGLLAPAVLILALWSVIRRLARDRHEVLAELHPGVADLLPEGVSLAAHHRAWSECVALPVTSRGDLARLLHESSAALGQAGQLRVKEVWERLAHSPGCVVRVTDSRDAEIQLGYYIVYPLLAQAVRQIRAGQVTADRPLGPADLAAGPGAAAGWCVSAIWAPAAPKWARRCVIATLVDVLAANGAGTTARPVFAHPATEQGRSLMERYGFVAIGAPAGNIWALQK
jgi:hypothetical protein